MDRTAIRSIQLEHIEPRSEHLDRTGEQPHVDLDVCSIAADVRRGSEDLVNRQRVRVCLHLLL